MRIEANNPCSGDGDECRRTDVYQGTKNGAAAERDRDEIQLPGPEPALRRAWDIVRSTPELRAERIQAIRASIADGTYHVAGRDVARKMVQELLLDPPC